MVCMEMRREHSVTRFEVYRSRRMLAAMCRRHALPLRFMSLAPKHGQKSNHARPSENSDKRSEPDHVKDGVAMFRDLAGALAPGRTVKAQIRAVSRALYGHLAIGWRRTKACAYGEAGPPTVLNFKYRYEAWKLKFVSRAETLAERELKAMAKRLDALEAKSGGMDKGDPGVGR